MKNLKLFLVGLLALSLVGCDGTGDACEGDACNSDDNGVVFTGASDDERNAPTAAEYFENVASDDETKSDDELIEEVIEEEVVEEEVLEEEVVEEEIVDDTTLEDLEDEVNLEDLEATDLAEIDVLRTAIFSGIDAGTEQYMESVSLALAELEITPSYGALDINGWEVLDEPVSACPYVEFYDNGFEPTGYACEYLVHQARSEAYSKLAAKLASQALPVEVADSELVDEEEALFWMEQGAISGIEEQRVLVELDIKAKGLCNQEPTPSQSSADKGTVSGRQLMVNSMNNWLATNGYKADYPVMSEPIEVCNMNATVLNPAEQDAINSISQFIQENPLCEDYAPLDSNDDIYYDQAQKDYSDALKIGVKDEFALAAVKIFKVVPCNVSDPLILDLDRDGIELNPVHRGVNFDLWSSGDTHAVAWTQGDDGFLALDRNGNQVIDNGSELFGNINGGFADGFDQLKELDSAAMGGNEDGRIDAEDAAFNQLRIWKDSNVDGVSTIDEVLSLDTYQITGMNLTAVETEMMEAGNPIPAISYVETAEGPMLMGDALLRTAPYASLSSLMK